MAGMNETSGYPHKIQYLDTEDGGLEAHRLVDMSDQEGKTRIVPAEQDPVLNMSQNEVQMCADEFPAYNYGGMEKGASIYRRALYVGLKDLCTAGQLNGIFGTNSIRPQVVEVFYRDTFKNYNRGEDVKEHRFVLNLGFGIQPADRKTAPANQ